MLMQAHRAHFSRGVATPWCAQRSTTTACCVHVEGFGRGELGAAADAAQDRILASLGHPRSLMTSALASMPPPDRGSGREAGEPGGDEHQGDGKPEHRAE
jgi:hypothetical protein